MKKLKCYFNSNNKQKKLYAKNEARIDFYVKEGYKDLVDGIVIFSVEGSRDELNNIINEYKKFKRGSGNQ